MRNFYLSAILILVFGSMTNPAAAKSDSPSPYECPRTEENHPVVQGLKSIEGALSTAASYLLTGAGYAIDGTAYLLVPAAAGSLLCMVPAVQLARVEDKHWGTGQISGFGGIFCFQEVINRIDSRFYVPQLGKRAYKATASWRCQ